MKAYALLFFLLLFYSINSNTKNINRREECKNKLEKCNASCAKYKNFGTSLIKNCRFKCQMDYSKCIFFNGRTRK